MTAPSDRPSMRPKARTVFGRTLALLPLLLASGVAAVYLVDSGTTPDPDPADPRPASKTVVSLAATPEDAALAMDNMAPGDKVVGPLELRNTGTVTVRYTMTGVMRGSLGAALLTTVKTGVGSCTADAFATQGTVVYGPARLPAGPTDLFRADDFTVGQTQRFCVQVQMSEDADNHFAGHHKAVADFAFNAIEAAAPAGAQGS